MQNFSVDNIDWRGKGRNENRREKTKVDLFDLQVGFGGEFRRLIRKLPVIDSLRFPGGYAPSIAVTGPVRQINAAGFTLGSIRHTSPRNPRFCAVEDEIESGGSKAHLAHDPTVSRSGFTGLAFAEFP